MKRICCFLWALAAWPAELLIRNGLVWTGDESKPWVTTVLICNEKTVAVGTEADVQLGPGATVIDAKGRVATFGFNDEHLHFLGGALGLRDIELTEICTLKAIQKAVGAFITPNRPIPISAQALMNATPPG